MYNWVTRRKIARTEGPNYPVRAAQTVDAVVAKWIPVTAALLACAVTPARPKLDVRSYEWQPAFTWVRPVVDANVRTYIPAVSAELRSERVRERPSLDVRRYDWAPESFDLVIRVDAQVRSWMPAAGAELASQRTDARRLLDVRSYEWGVDETSWISATQSPAATVAQTWPAFQQSALSARTPDGPRLDVRRYDWAPEYIDVRQVDAQVQTWLPAFQTLTPRTADGAKLDVRRYEWAPESVDALSRVTEQVQTWTPAFQPSGLITPRGPQLDLRAYDWAPQPVSTAALTSPPDNGGSGPSGATGSGWLVRRIYERTTGPQPVYTATLPAAPITDAQASPAILEASGLSYRSAARAALDVRGYDWAPSSAWITTSIPATTPPTVAQTLPATQPLSVRTADRARLDVRLYAWSASEASWIAATQPVSVSVAQTAPAWTNQAQSYRSRSAPPLDVFRAQSIPDIFGVPDDWITWVPIQDDGARTRDRARLDVRAYEWGQPAWVYTSLPVATTDAQKWPAIVDRGLSYRSAARPALDVRRFEWAPVFGWVQPVVDAALAPLAPIFDAQLASYRTSARQPLDVRAYDWSSSAWIFTALPVTATDAQTWPAIVEASGISYRTAARPTLDVRAYEWAPAFSWVQPVVDAVVARFTPVFGTELASVRTADRARLDVRSCRWAPDDAAWELINFAPPATAAQIWPALLQNLGTEYQTPARARLDVRRHDWQPAFTWVAPVVDTTVAKWAPVFVAQVSPRTPARPPDTVSPFLHRTESPIFPNLGLEAFPDLFLKTTVVSRMPDRTVTSRMPVRTVRGRLPVYTVRLTREID